MKFTLSNGNESVELTNYPFVMTKSLNFSGLEADVQFVDSNLDGSIYQKSRFKQRDFQIEGAILVDKMTDATIQNYRNQLYRIANPKKMITITMDDGVDSYFIKGYPTTLPLFNTGYENTNKKYQKFLIQISSGDPFIYHNTKTVVFADVVPNLEFPLAFTQVDFGEKSNSLIETIVNNGIMDCPITITMTAGGTVVNPRLTNIYTGEKISFTCTMNVGDEIYINTGLNKEVSLIQNGVKKNFYYAMNLDSTFLQLALGDNVYEFGADSGEEYLEISVAYNEKKGGF